MWITDDKDLNPDGKDFAVRKQTAKSDGKEKSAKNTLPLAFCLTYGKEFAVS